MNIHRVTKAGKITRRNWFAGVAATTLAGSIARSAIAKSATSVKPVASKSVAAVLTAYEKGLHADVLIGKILEGWKQDGGPGPDLKLASMYVDQFTDRDMACAMSKKYNVPLFDSIEKVLDRRW